MYTNEDTILDSEQTMQNVQKSNEDESTVLDQNTEAPAKGAEEPAKKNQTLKNVAVNAGLGFALGSLGALLTSAVSADVLNEDETPITPDTPVSTDGTLPVATSVTDDMSFSEAFQAAHDEVGPGGVFEWHGQLYHTFTEEEWNSLSPEEQQEFSGHLQVNGETDYASNVEHHTTPQHTETEVEVVGHEAPETHDVAQNTEVDPGEPVVEPVVAEEPVVEVLGVEQVATDDGGYVTVGSAAIDGQAIVVIDVDNDGMGDIMATDINGNGQVDDNEIIDISADPIAMSNFEVTGTNDGPETDYLA